MSTVAGATASSAGFDATDRVIYITNAAAGSLPPNWDTLDEVSKPLSVGGVVMDRADQVSAASVFHYTEEGFSIMRCRADGSQVEVVARQVLVFDAVCDVSLTSRVLWNIV
jgi:hypothetical protein